MVSFVDIEDIDVDLNHFNQLYPTFQQSTNNQYFDSNKFNTKFNEHNDKNLNIIHFNARSMNANGDGFSSFLSTLNIKFDIVCICETWYNVHSGLDIFFPSYKGFHVFREGERRGGGVSIYVRRKLNSEIVPHLTVCRDS